MKDFNMFLKKLLQNPTSETTLIINGKKKKIMGMAQFRTVNMGDSEYIKIAFEDHSFLLILLEDKEFYYSDTYIVSVPEVTDEMIGTTEKIMYKGKEYKLVNKDDYQYVKHLFIGTIDDIEGEVKFSDYFPANNEKEFLSLGWIMKTGKRADVNPFFLEQEKIDIG